MQDNQGPVLIFCYSDVLNKRISFLAFFLPPSPPSPLEKKKRKPKRHNTASVEGQVKSSSYLRTEGILHLQKGEEGYFLIAILLCHLEGSFERTAIH